MPLIRRNHDQNEVDTDPFSKFISEDNIAEPSIGGSDFDEFLPIISTTSKSNWSPCDEVLNWYTKVADIDLSDEQAREISDKYVPSSSISSHFEPPHLPPALWQKTKSSAQNTYKERSLFRIQSLSTSAIKPLLDVLDSLDAQDPNREKIASSIQLICSANLRTSRMRRAITSKFIKPELRQNLFSQPINHLALFGTEFATAAENANKAQATIQKVVSNNRPFHNFKPSSSQVPVTNFRRADYSHGANQPGSSFGQGRKQSFHFNPRGNFHKGRSSFRGRGKFSRK